MLMDAFPLLDVFKHMIYFSIVGLLIILTPGLIIGLLVSIFQAATQINEMTLSFLPKLIVILLVIAVLSPWLFQQLTDYTENLYLNLRHLIT